MPIQPERIEQERIEPERIRPEQISTVLCDLDGVVWLAHVAIDGAAEAVADIRASGRRVLFVTNNSAAEVAQHEAALDAVGIAAVGDVVSSAMAAARLVHSGEVVLVAGGSGVVEAVRQRGATVIVNDATFDPRDPLSPAVDAVVVGLHRDFDYDRLAAAASAIHLGARLIGTNSDSTYPTPHGLDPGGGAILAAVATAGGTTPIIGGKPHVPMGELIAEVLTTPDAAFDPATALMVGDRLETDGLMAATMGCPFALVRSGVTRPGDHVIGDVSLDVADLAAVGRYLTTTSTLT